MHFLIQRLTTVSNNKIKSLRKGKADAYTVGLHVANFSKNKDMNNSVITLSKNTVIRWKTGNYVFILIQVLSMVLLP